MIKEYTKKVENLSFICDKCGKEIRPKAWFFATEEEIINFKQIKIFNKV